MKNKIIIPTILFVIVLFFSIFVLLQEKNKNKIIETTLTENQSTNQIILFYGDGCPHCAIVEEYLNQNNIETKVPFIKKEVYYNKQNANDLVEKAKLCGLSTNSIGVPFLWDGKKCLIGDRDIIEFFKSKINNQ